VQNSIRVQPEIKIADVKPEVLVAEIVDEIYVKFQRKRIFFGVERHGGTNISTIRHQGE